MSVVPFEIGVLVNKIPVNRISFNDALAIKLAIQIRLWFENVTFVCKLKRTMVVRRQYIHFNMWVADGGQHTSHKTGCISAMFEPQITNESAFLSS